MEPGNQGRTAARSLQSTAKVDKEDAWAFAVACYEEPGRAKQLLHLQDEQGLDIVLDLFKEYALARLGRILDTEAIADATSALARWRAEVILPVRTLRRMLKEPEGFAPVPHANAVELRARLAQAELQAERAQMDALCEWLETRQ